MDINGVLTSSSSLTSALSLLTVLCSSLSCIGLALSLAIFTVVPGLQSDRTTIHRHLCLTLLLAHLLLLGGLDATQPPLLCSGVALALHYLLLSSFCWMLVEGCHIYRLLTDVFSHKQFGLLPYYLVGYGLPLLIVLPSLVSSELLSFRGYGSSEYCWLSTTNGFIWAFAGPVAAIVTVNCIIFGLAMSVARHARSRNTQREKNVVGKSVTWLKGSASLLSILGLGWLTGFLYLTQGLAWTGVVFTVLNSLQGLAIFLLHVAFNDQVRHKLRSHLQVKHKKPSNHISVNLPPFQRQFHIFEFRSLSRNTTVKSTMRSRGLDRGRSDLSFTEDTRTQSVSASYSLELSVSELDKSQGEQEVVEAKQCQAVEWNNNDRPEPEPEPDY